MHAQESKIGRVVSKGFLQLVKFVSKILNFLNVPIFAMLDKFKIFFRRVQHVPKALAPLRQINPHNIFGNVLYALLMYRLQII